MPRGLRKRKGGSAMLPPFNSLAAYAPAFEYSWSTYSQFTRLSTNAFR